LKAYSHQVLIFSGDKPVVAGNGVFLDNEGSFLTAWHLLESVKQDARVSVAVFDGTFWGQRQVDLVLAFSVKLDFMILHIGQASGLAVPIATLPPRIW
jgi:hypothetical protein